MVIVPAEMAKPDILQTGIIMGRQELCGLPITQMPGGARHPLFQESGICTETKHLLVIVRFQY